MLFQIRDIRYDHIDTEHIIIREGHTAVQYHNISAKLKHRQILSDLIEPSQRDDFQFLIFCHNLTSIFILIKSVQNSSHEFCKKIYDNTRRTTAACIKS